MKRSLSLISVALLSLAVAFSGCSRKGSSSVTNSHKSTTTKTTPKVRPTTTSTSQQSLKAAQEAEAKAKAAAEEAKAAAQKAKEEADAKAQAALEEAIQVKEEKVTVVESNDAIDDANRYHVIIGSFKKLTNARTLCQDAISKNFLPSIMENEDGLYRVAICSFSSEQTARKRIAALRTQHKEYVGMWLLVEKK